MLTVRRLLPLMLAASVLIFAFGTTFAQDQGAASMTFEDQVKLFDYDASADFELKENGTEQRGDVTIKDITFTGVPDKTIDAYLVTPKGEGLFAGILWVHWLGEEKSNRDEFLDEAVELASKGTVSLLINAMWSKPGWYGSRNLDEDYANGIQQVIEMRRAMDLLASQPGVDKDRLGFVGHDFGGMYGTIFAGADNRAKAYVFIAVTPSLFDWAFFAAEPKSRVDYLRQNAPLEPLPFLQHVKDASVFFQFAGQDIYVGVMKAAEYFGSAPEPRKQETYADADHTMTVPKVKADRDAWLTETLGLSA